MGEPQKADLEKCFEEMAGLLYLGLQATHEARTKALFVYQTLFNPALTHVHISQNQPSIPRHHHQQYTFPRLQGESNNTCGITTEGVNKNARDSFINNVVRALLKANFCPMTSAHISFAATAEPVSYCHLSFSIHQYANSTTDTKNLNNNY